MNAVVGKGSSYAQYHRPPSDDPPRGVRDPAGAELSVVGCGISDALEIVAQLDEVDVTDLDRYSKLEVEGRTFGYLWRPTRTVGLRQTLAEQAALVGERPEVFEVQFTAWGFGWVVVHLDGVDRDELAELVFEAWRLTASESLRLRRGDRLPV